MKCYSGVNNPPTETEECDVGHNVCQTTVLAGEAVDRTCGLATHGNGCVESSQEGLDAKICQCKTDLCNGSSAGGATPTTLATVLFIAVLVSSAFLQ